jgi:hypothetical protein
VVHGDSGWGAHGSCGFVWNTAKATRLEHGVSGVSAVFCPRVAHGEGSIWVAPAGNLVSSTGPFHLGGRKKKTVWPWLGGRTRSTRGLKDAYAVRCWQKTIFYFLGVACVIALGGRAQGTIFSSGPYYDFYAECRTARSELSPVHATTRTQHPGGAFALQYCTQCFMAGCGGGYYTVLCSITGSIICLVGVKGSKINLGHWHEGMHVCVHWKCDYGVTTMLFFMAPQTRPH